jgi:hypothetical protein
MSFNSCCQLETNMRENKVKDMKHSIGGNAEKETNVYLYIYIYICVSVFDGVL